MQERGYIAVLATLIIGAVSLTVTLGMLLLGVSNQQSTLATQWSLQARDMADACAEEGLLQIQNTTSFTGTNTITIDNQTCSYTVVSTGVSTRTITTTSTVGSVVRKVLLYVTISTSSISITSWQEVS